MNDSDRNVWCRAVDAVIRGEADLYRAVRLGPTPARLRSMGLAPVDLTMTAAKIAKVRKIHPEISIDTWYRLHEQLADPFAIFQSTRDDGTIIVIITVLDVAGNPIVVPIFPGGGARPNTILSIYGKDGTHRLSGHEWVRGQIAAAKREGKPVYEKKGSADSKPKPGSAEAIPWSPDLISVDRPTEPKRLILKLPAKSRER